MEIISRMISARSSTSSSGPFSLILSPRAVMVVSGNAFSSRFTLFFKDAAPCYQHIGAFLNQFGGITSFNPAINFNEIVQAELFTDGVQFINFLIGGFNKRLASKTRIHAHYQNHVQIG